MKCFFVGVFDEKSTNYSQAKCMRHSGIEVVEYPYRSVARQLGIDGRNRDMEKKVREVNPAFVLIAKGNTIDQCAVQVCKNICPTILWYPDPMNSNWNTELQEKIKMCDATVCALYRPWKEAEKIAPKAFFVQEGFDPDVDRPFENAEYEHDVVFIGGIDQHRQAYRQAYPFDVVSAWKTEHARVCATSKINLNFVRVDSGCSDRVYKILAAGGFLMTERWPGLEEDFAEDRDLVVFRDAKEMKAKINHYLNTTAERKAIALQGRETVQKFSRLNWAKRIVDIAKKL